MLLEEILAEYESIYKDMRCWGRLLSAAFLELATHRDRVTWPEATACTTASTILLMSSGEFEQYLLEENFIIFMC